MVEWIILSFVVLVITGILGYKLQKIHSQTELAAAQYTVGSLRTAMVLEHLRLKVDQDEEPRLRNPFELLDPIPSNFVGERAMTEAHTVPPGHWFFDPFCECIAYRLLYSEWLDEPTGSEIISFRVALNRKEGLLTLHPLYPIVWLGVRIG